MKPVVAPELVKDAAVHLGVCPRPMVRRCTDTQTGETSHVPIPCGSTRATVCPPCAEKARRLRMQQCREGWHLEEEPPRPTQGVSPADTNSDTDPDQDRDQDDTADQEEESSRRVRSTRRRSDVPDLPRLKVETRTLGRTFTGKDGKVWRPSMFVTLTLPSYGPIHTVSADGSCRCGTRNATCAPVQGTPIDPARYDYRRAALDALHLPKLFDRFVQNLRRAVGYDAQYFGVLEPQRRLAPHLHVAIRGAIPRSLLKQVIEATYASVWWPPHETPVYTGDRLPVWNEAQQGYSDPQTGRALPTWEQALDTLDTDQDASPAHLVRFGPQSDIQGLIGGSKDADRRVGYLTKYLTKSVNEPLNDDDQDHADNARRQAHVARLHREVRHLPCSPQCANWLRYGIQPKGAAEGLKPGYCKAKAHDSEHLGCGGRRVLVSRRWTGKTLADHKADRATAIRLVLEAAGMAMDDHHAYSATTTTDDGEVRWVWENLTREEAGMDYARVINLALVRRNQWREQYEQAKARLGPDHPSLFGNSATEERSRAA